MYIKLKLSVSVKIIATIFNVNVWRGLEAFIQNKGLWDETKPLLDIEEKQSPAVALPGLKHTDTEDDNCNVCRNDREYATAYGRTCEIRRHVFIILGN
jgi:hypothetical protein